ncbi:MAG: ribonuclease R, partial [Gammaproteobacteria bacterium]|nr:ribonuclease R [Gammaproteobacteria bacterium]
KKDPFGQREAAKYERPIPSREFLLDYILELDQPMNQLQLQRALKLTSKVDQEALRRRLRAMVRDGQLIKTRRGKLDIAQQGDLIRGHVVGHREGFGFVAPEDGTSRIFLSAREMKGVLDGDIVQARVIGMDRHNRREGMVTEIIERKHKEVVGRFYLEGMVGFVRSDNPRINQDVIIPIEFRGEAQSGQIVNVELISSLTVRSQPVGRVVEILGEYMAPGLEIEMAIRSYALPHIWLEDVQRQLDDIPREISASETKHRVDLRDTGFVTIDGKDAKDFDDAVYCEKRPRGGWHLLVAIADVGHYVQTGTALDLAAQERGNSAYFPGQVVPMLPAVLSNNLCSLKPQKDRLTVVCDMFLSKNGRLMRSRFYEAVIRSQARLTYRQVAQFLKDGQVPAGMKNLSKPVSEKVVSSLRELDALHKILLEKRVSRGALDFDTPEIKVEFGAQRKIKRLYVSVREDSHRIIEECMLCANVSAAQYLLENDLNSLFRVHDGPKTEKLQALKIFLGELGLKLKGGDLPLPKDYSQLLKDIQSRPDAHIIQMILLRSLSQAIYTPDNDGHFGLAFDAYTHFTSPIRRYADLIVHRAIKASLHKRKQNDIPSYDTLKTIGEHCSMTERRADEATRDALDWLKCEYILDKVGEEFDAVVSSVTGHGIYCELKDIYVEGLIHISSLKNDYYRFDAIRHRLIGERTHKTFRLGDVLKVRLDRVDLEDKNIDFSLV